MNLPDDGSLDDNAVVVATNDKSEEALSFAKRKARGIHGLDRTHEHSVTLGELLLDQTSLR